MKNYKIYLNILWASLLSATWISDSHSMETWRPTPSEMTSLPPYCAAKWNGGAEATRWRAEYGEDFLHVHHYCVGLNSLNRYYRSNNQKNKAVYIKTAMNQWNYMLNNSKKDSHHYWNYHFQKGLTFLLTKHYIEAIQEFQSALKRKPNASEVYIKLSDAYKEYNNKQLALEAITEAIRHNPDIKGLKQRYLDLGGKEPYPEPYNKAILVEKKIPVQQSDTAKTIKEEFPKDIAIKTETKTIDAISPIEIKPKFGSQRNPWCRFCPEETSSKQDRPPSTP